MLMKYIITTHDAAYIENEFLVVTNITIFLMILLNIIESGKTNISNLEIKSFLRYN